MSKSFILLTYSNFYHYDVIRPCCHFILYVALSGSINIEFQSCENKYGRKEGYKLTIESIKRTKAWHKYIYKR